LYTKSNLIFFKQLPQVIGLHVLKGRGALQMLRQVELPQRVEATLVEGLEGKAGKALSTRIVLTILGRIDGHAGWWTWQGWSTIGSGRGNCLARRLLQLDMIGHLVATDGQLLLLGLEEV